MNKKTQELQDKLIEAFRRIRELKSEVLQSQMLANRPQSLRINPTDSGFRPILPRFVTIGGTTYAHQNGHVYKR